MNFEWFKQAKKGLMIHWGLYSVFGGQYNGKQSCNYAEWIQSYFRIPNSEMKEISKLFNPIKFDADSWVKFAKDNDFDYIIFTAKHHDGFAMYNSKVDSYNICQMSLYKKDIVQELSEACKKFNIKFGVYYSQDLDWNEKNGGGYKTPVIDCAGTSWSNNWDFDDCDKDFNEYFYRKSLPQIKELMTMYGEISIAWFDIPFTLSESQSKEIYDLVKKYQPKCLINSRLGNGVYDYVTFGDNEIPNSENELAEINSGANDLNGIKKSPYGLYEVCCTTNQSWGYTKNAKWKSINELRNSLAKANKLNINFLVNIGPNEFGEFPNKAKELLEALKI